MGHAPDGGPGRAARGIAAARPGGVPAAVRPEWSAAA